MTNIDFSDSRLPDSHYQLLASALPTWLGNASADKRQALAKTQPQPPLGSAMQQAALKRLTGAHWDAQNTVDRALQNLQDVKTFAPPILQQALKAKFGLELDVDATFVRLYIPDSVPWLPIRSGAARTWTVSLLDAALHNFEHRETLADAYGPASTFITRPSASGQFDTLPNIKRVLSISAFTGLCRDLDIGARYARYLNEQLGASNPVATAVLRLKVDASHKAAMQVALQLARIRGRYQRGLRRLDRRAGRRHAPPQARGPTVALSRFAADGNTPHGHPIICPRPGISSVAPTPGGLHS